MQTGKTIPINHLVVIGLLHHYSLKVKFRVMLRMLQLREGLNAQVRCFVYSAFILTLSAVLSAYIAAVSLHHLIVLKEEISSLRQELATYKFQLDHLETLTVTKGLSSNWSTSINQVNELHEKRLHQREKWQEEKIKLRGRRSLPEQEKQSFVQFIAVRDQRPLLKVNDCLKYMHERPQSTCRVERRSVSNENSKQETTIPWILSLKNGNALVKKDNHILVKEAGYFLVYSQVWYKDNSFTMGHFIQRRKANSVGSEPRAVILFRCIQNMSACCPNDSCFTAGIAKLEVGDELELIIPRIQAQIALKGDGTFFGAIKLL
ncbi:tumor necrosis factor ligand superfamily member 13B isoform X1 [Stegostoma tigrinum]|uniref:tumor necrosis factor ligand superfamily member 13B isoform X1 n=1 Tax=Stegostoma tigrinum TaxID=3053191 RepID=UPI00286FC59F|nr:tumor necrosis factor ligand superfamily member 13B isoform X1 [Stegostoma tigrinum]